MSVWVRIKVSIANASHKHPNNRAHIDTFRLPTIIQIGWQVGKTDLQFCLFAIFLLCLKTQFALKSLVIGWGKFGANRKRKILNRSFLVV
jgi:hypothetical protein